MRTKNRREFLLGAGITLSSAAAHPRLLGEASTIRANPQSTKGALRSGADASVPVHTTMRGLMVDAGRVPESIDYYRRVIEFCADWELNTLHFRIADDQGSALRFTSVADLLTHKNAFTSEQLKSLADYARSHGVDLIPELESFGHTGYITRSATYAHLLDDSAQGRSEFTGIIPVSPEALHLFDTLYREVASIFPSIYFHGGCDEVA